MAILSMFYGIIINMYYFDNRKHHIPHIHVKYQEYEMVVSILDGSVLEGEIPINKRKLVDAWIVIHKDELLADWELVIAGERIFQIEPLK